MDALSLADFCATAAVVAALAAVAGGRCFQTRSWVRFRLGRVVLYKLVSGANCELDIS